MAVAGRKVQQLDQEWEKFVEATLQKVHQHAQMFQQCRSDLLEAYNLKLGELTALKQEMSSASVSMLGEMVLSTSIPEMPDVDEQIKDLSAVISLEGTVGTVDLTSDMEEDDATDHPKASMKGSPKPLKTSRGATSPTKVAQQHLKPRSQDVREMKQKEREAAS